VANDAGVQPVQEQELLANWVDLDVFRLWAAGRGDWAGAEPVEGAACMSTTPGDA